MAFVNMHARGSSASSSEHWPPSGALGPACKMRLRKVSSCSTQPENSPNRAHNTQTKSSNGALTATFHLCSQGWLTTVSPLRPLGRGLHGALELRRLSCGRPTASESVRNWVGQRKFELYIGGNQHSQNLKLYLFNRNA